MHRLCKSVLKISNLIMFSVQSLMATMALAVYMTMFVIIITTESYMFLRLFVVCNVWDMERIKLLDVAVFSAERNIAQKVRQQGMEPEFFAITRGWVGRCGRAFY